MLKQSSNHATPIPWNEAIANAQKRCLRPIPENIPVLLKDLKRWVAWRYEISSDGWSLTKVPFYDGGSSTSCIHASSTLPRTWMTFAAALTLYREGCCDGLSLALSCGHDDGIRIVGVDLDDAVSDGGRLKPWAQLIVERFRSYTEFSPSGRGIRVLAIGNGPSADDPKKQILADDPSAPTVELYCEKRFLTITGHMVGASASEPIENQEAIDELIERMSTARASRRKKSSFPPKRAVATPSQPVTSERIAEVLRRIRRSGHWNRALHSHLSGESLQRYHFDESRRDVAVTGLIFRFCRGDRDLLEATLRTLPIARPKWDDLRADKTWLRGVVEYVN